MIVAGSFSHRNLFTTITLLTDFGTADGYVAAVKGVIASRVSGVHIIDATHEISPGDIFAGAHALRRYWNRYPTGTLHLAVIDPGVGSTRRAIAARADGYLFVAPDNGLLSLVLDDAREKTVIAMTNSSLLPRPESHTFHARDVFAPAAAQLLCGTELQSFGPAISDWVRLQSPTPAVSDNTVMGVVISADHFGNLQTNIPARLIAAGALILLGNREVGVVARTYSDVSSQEPIALINSDDMLEIAVRDGSAARVLHAQAGTPVTVLGDR